MSEYTFDGERVYGYFCQSHEGLGLLADDLPEFSVGREKRTNDR